MFIKPMTNNTEKERLRKWAKDLRKGIALKRASIEIQNKIKSLQIYKSSCNVMSYLAKDIEISLEDLFLDNSKNWFLPVVETLHATSLQVVPYHHGKTKLIKNKFNILEPEIINNIFFDQKEKKINLDLIFVPGLCFDKNRNRIGFGRGFYDEFLKLNQNSFKIGSCPKECLVDKLPVDNWDQKVDLVVTD
ncbi:MAG: 5-formyltetrahydrofolate cyclo-ligase [Candidatus Melainabacteria bacterium]|nr:5-formyltetrahydrofolate cyclo-ligase [Candidatus Melainabacteria bacterium]